MNCRICKYKKLTKILNLGKQPWCNDFLKKNRVGKEKKYPLELFYCQNCFLVQLGFTVKKEIMFNDHTYLSGVTKTLDKHFKFVLNDIEKRFNFKSYKGNILDIGSNDGTFLKNFKKKGWDVLGIEPAKRISNLANKNGIKTINKFFNYKTARKIKQSFDFINASGVFFHLEELHSFTKGVEWLLKPNGVFIVQFLYMKSIVQNTAFDQIYHEHLLYYNLYTLEKLLNLHNLHIFDCYLCSVHGGQMVAYISKKNVKKKTSRFYKFWKKEKTAKCNSLNFYKKFVKKISLLKQKNLNFLKECKNKNLVVYGFGAPVKGNTLLNYFKIKKNLISLLVEKNPMRENLFAPGSHIPIKMESKLKKYPDVYYVLAWNFKKEILKNNKGLIKKGVKFYFPINPK